MRQTALLMLTVGVLSLSGCATMGMRMLPEDQGAKIDDPWSGDVGQVARTEHPAEPIHDPLGMRNFFTSEKARQIERNVGVGD